MANPVVRPCASCGAPVETRRTTSTPTCSPRCYQRIRRERHQETSSLDFIIGGRTFTLMNVPRGIDHNGLRNSLAEALGDELAAKIENTHPTKPEETK
jgi:hypothetical protein